MTTMQNKCVVCGRPLPVGQKVVCTRKSCLKEYKRLYNQEYRDKNRDKIRRWLRESQKRRLARREPNHCIRCGVKLPNYKYKYCEKCKYLHLLEVQRNYYNQHKEREAERKANWYRAKRNKNEATKTSTNNKKR